MNHLTFNFTWMGFNVVLALIPVLFGWVMYKNKIPAIRIICAFIWFFFLPNTIYLLTDFINLFHDLHFISGLYVTLDIALYLVLMPIGVVTYILAVYPFEKLITKKMGLNKTAIIIFLNLFMGFGLVLGRIQRANSWEILTSIQSIISKSIAVVSSLELLAFVLIFAILCQAVYLIFRQDVLKRFKLK